MNNIAIIGGGPAGIFCALTILEDLKNNNFNNYSISIFDKSQILRTILPTGNGRCNITNSISDLRDFCSNYPRGEKFLYSLFSRFSNFDTLEFFSSIGVETYCQEDGRIFPISNSAKDVKDKLLNRLRQFKNVKLINKEILSKDELSDFKYCVLACGSRQVETLLKSFEIDFIPFKKALCGLKIENNIFPPGVSVQSLDGDFIFTHEGVSGPLIFKLSSINVDKKFPYEIKIHLFEADELLKLSQEFPKKSFGNLVSRFIPKSLAQVIVKNYNQNACEVSKKTIEELSYLRLKVLGTISQGEIVNAGGIHLDSLDKNCKIKNRTNLWACGEVLNIDGMCGGFNLQNCWSSAYVVAKDICSIINK